MLVDYIELEQELHPICYPTAAFAEFEKRAGITALEFIEQLETGRVSFTHLTHLVAAGLNSGARKTKTGKIFSSEDAGDIFGLMDIPKLMPILSAYMSTKTTDPETEKNDPGATLPEA